MKEYNDFENTINNLKKGIKPPLNCDGNGWGLKPVQDSPKKCTHKCQHKIKAKIRPVRKINKIDEEAYDKCTDIKKFNDMIDTMRTNIDFVIPRNDIESVDKQSKTCPICGHSYDKDDLSVVFNCPNCEVELSSTKFNPKEFREEIVELIDGLVNEIDTISLRNKYLEKRVSDLEKSIYNLERKLDDDYTDDYTDEDTNGLHVMPFPPIFGNYTDEDED